MSNKKTTGIYALCCPVSGDVKYIGQSVNISSRYYGHKVSNTKLPVSKWINYLKGQGLTPSLRILEECQKTDLDRLEEKHIQEHGISNLYNVHAGGKASPSRYWKSKTGNVMAVAGFDHPRIVFTRRTFIARNNEVLRDWLREVSGQYNKLKGLEKIRGAMWFAQWIINNSTVAEERMRMERYVILVVPQINAKYPNALSIEYNDGVVDTP